MMILSPIIVILTWLQSHGKGNYAGRRNLAMIILRAESNTYFEVILCILWAPEKYLFIFLVLSIEY